MLSKIIAIAIAVLLISAPQAVQASGCVLQLANGDSHSSTSQHLLVNLENRIAASRYLSLTDTVGSYDFELYLVRALTNDITRYRKDHGFRVFYVITDSHQKMISADVLACTGNGEACATSLVREMEATCGRRSSNSIKPNSLRGSA